MPITARYVCTRLSTCTYHSKMWATFSINKYLPQQDMDAHVYQHAPTTVRCGLLFLSTNTYHSKIGAHLFYECVLTATRWGHTSSINLMCSGVGGLGGPVYAQFNLRRQSSDWSSESGSQPHVSYLIVIQIYFCQCSSKIKVSKDCLNQIFHIKTPCKFTKFVLNVQVPIEVY